MNSDLQSIQAPYRQPQNGRVSQHSVDNCFRPSRMRYGWLLQRNLSRDVRTILSLVRHIQRGKSTGIALDAGLFRCRYRSLLETQGSEVKTLDLTLEFGADPEECADSIGLLDSSVDLHFFDQVLELPLDPWLALDEFKCVVVPGGRIVFAVPPVWSYVPHPGDFWRVTHEELDLLCKWSGIGVEDLCVKGGTVAAIEQMLNVVLYGLLGRLGTPLFAIVASAGDLLDIALPNPLFTLNVARKAHRLP